MTLHREGFQVATCCDRSAWRSVAVLRAHKLGPSFEFNVALIKREIEKSKIDFDDFCKWML